MEDGVCDWVVIDGVDGGPKPGGIDGGDGLSGVGGNWRIESK